MNRDRTAVLMTCYNRKTSTLACLAVLFNQVLPPEVTFDVYLTQQGYQQAIVTGSIRDAQMNTLVYSGMVRASQWCPLKFRMNIFYIRLDWIV